MHRYLNLHWWVLRVAPGLRRLLSDEMIMDLIGRTSYFSPEREVRRLSAVVPSQRLAVDVGAANGVYSWNLARLARRCIAFEANPESAERLDKGLPNVELNACALSSANGTAHLRVPVRSGIVIKGYATIEPSNELHGFDRTVDYQVSTRTLDSFHLDDVGFIKIDVEGHELAVLEGSESTILRDKPVLLIEISAAAQQVEQTSTWKWLNDRGYYRVNWATSTGNYLFMHESQKYAEGAPSIADL